MHKLLSFTLAASAIALSFNALAETSASTAVTTSVKASVPAVAQVSTSAVAPSTDKADSAKAMPSELKDGTKIEIAADGTVSVFNADGTKTTAPDGILTLKDDTTISVKDGKKVN